MRQMRIVIVGGGPGGYEAALVAAEDGADVTLVTDEGLGGNSVLWWCVPSKSLIVSAEAMGWVESAHQLGVRDSAGSVAAPATADMGAVVDRIARLAADQSADIAKKVDAAGVRVVEGHGRLAARDVVAVGDERFPADVVLLATGSRPRVLPFFRPDGERVFTSPELFKLRDVPERLIVVGSGATGAEYAHAFRRLGAEVHLVSSREQVLPNEDSDAAAVIEEVFERRGVVIHRQRRAVDMELVDGGVRVKTRVTSATGGSEDQWVEGSHVLYCVGQVPASDELGLDVAGVEVAPHGAITVDGVSRTNIPTIYAAGDVTGRMMLSSVAAMQGRNAMWHALGEAVAPIRWDAVTACIFTDPEVAAVGLSAREATAAHYPVETVSLRFAGNPRAKMRANTDGFVKIRALEGSGTVLGGTIVADGASDLVTSLSIAVHSRLTVSHLAHAFSVYPSMSGSLMETARQLMGQTARVETV